MRKSVLTVLAWLAGEPIPTGSRQFLVIALVAWFAALGLSWFRFQAATLPLRSAKLTPALRSEPEDTRFGVPLAKRKEVFAEIAGGEPQARAEGLKSFPGRDLAWSAEDHRGAFERKQVASTAARFHLSTSVVYLILDEGIRAHWPGSTGEPLEGKTVPLHPRRNYGW